MTKPTADMDKKLDLIRKLLAQAEHPNTSTTEAEAFTARATELIAKYGIDAALLAAQADTREIPGDVVIVMHAPYVMDKSSLLQTIAKALGCRAIHREQRIGGVKQATNHLFGFAADLERVQMLYTSLLVQAAHALGKAEIPGYARRSAGSLAAWRRSWYAGYTDAIGKRLRAAERAAQDSAQPAAGQSVALVLADRSSLVSQAFTAAYPRTTSTTRTLSGGGQSAGRSAGERANLGGRSVAGAGRRGIGS